MSQTSVAPPSAPAGRVPPQCVDVELSLLGSLLLDPQAIARVESLKPDFFYLGQHQEIFRAMQQLQFEGRPTDLTMVSSALSDCEKLEKIGGRSYLVDLVSGVVSSANVDLFAELIYQKWVRRQLIGVGAQISQLAWEEGETGGLIGQAQELLSGLSGCLQGDWKKLADIAVEFAQDLQGILSGEKTVGIPTGFIDLDNRWPLEGGTLTLLAGRPAMGKTALAASIGINMALEGRGVVFISLEMSSKQVMRRWVSAHSGIELERIKKGDLSEKEQSIIERLLVRWIDAQPNFHFLEPGQIDSPNDLYAKALAKCREIEVEPGCLIVDHVHLLGDSLEEISYASSRLQKLSRNTSVPVIALCQLSRAVESRSEKRPQMSDLRASGRLEQDADLIMMLHREEYYNPDTPERGVMEVIGVKAREGATGTVKLLFEPQFSRLRNLARGF